MKQKKHNRATSHIRSLFSGLALATVLAISFGSCRKSADVITASKSIDKAISTEATPTSNGRYYHNIQIYIPSTQVVLVKFDTFWWEDPICKYNTRKVGWYNTGIRVANGDVVDIWYYKNSIACNVVSSTGLYKFIRGRVAPGNDGLSQWWIQ